jgi:hypothetical protein
MLNGANGAAHRRVKMSLLADIRRLMGLKDHAFDVNNVPKHHLPTTPTPPSIRIEPRSIALWYRGAANHEVVHEAFEFGMWCGEHNMKADIKIPGDGSIRIIFHSEEEQLMFKLNWTERIVRRSPVSNR